MRTFASLCVGILVVALLAMPAVAGKTVTLEGKVLCAKCTLHKDGQDHCQNVLVVEKKGKQKQYFMTKNETYEHFGEVCKGSTAVRVTGEVQKKDDGTRWIVASKIEPIDEEKKG